MQTQGPARYRDSVLHPRRIAAINSAKNAEITLAGAENIGHKVRIIRGLYDMYLWESLQWPALTWDEPGLIKLLMQIAREQGRLLGKMESVGFELRSEAHLHTLTEDVMKWQNS